MADATRRSTRFSVRSKQLGQLLLENGDVNADQVAKALKHQETNGGMLGGILQQMGACDDSAVAAALLKQVQVTDVRVEEIAVPNEVAYLVTRETCEASKLCPFERIGNLLCLLMASPLDSKSKTAIEQETHLKVKAFKAKWPDIQQLIAVTYDNLPPQEDAPADDGSLALEGEGDGTDMPPALELQDEPAAGSDQPLELEEPSQPMEIAPPVELRSPAAIIPPRRKPEAPKGPNIKGLDSLNEAAAEVVHANDRGLAQKKKRLAEADADDAIPKPKIEKRAKVNIDLDSFDTGNAAEVVGTPDAQGQEDGLEELPAAGRPLAPISGPRQSIESIVTLAAVSDGYFYVKGSPAPEGERAGDLVSLLQTLPKAEVIAESRAAYESKHAPKVLKSGNAPIEWSQAPDAVVAAVAISEADFKKAVANLGEDPVGEWDWQYAASGPVPALAYEEN